MNVLPSGLQGDAPRLLNGILRPGAKGDAAGSRRKELMNVLFRAGNLPASPRVLNGRKLPTLLSLPGPGP